MKTSAEEARQPMELALEKMGIVFHEIEDWNCCGSSSGHSLDADVPVALGARNLSRAPAGRPIAIPCPNCYRNMAAAQHHLKNDPERRRKYEAEFGPINITDPIVNTFEVFHLFNNMVKMGAVEAPESIRPLTGLKVAAYYGCGSMYPKYLRPAGTPGDLFERLLEEMGAETVDWPWPHKCCSAFASGVYADIGKEMANQIVGGAVDMGADCLATPCAMCQMNLDMRSLDREQKLPVFHLTQLLALYMGISAAAYPQWWGLHLIDPTPLLKARELWD